MFRPCWLHHFARSTLAPVVKQHAIVGEVRIVLSCFRWNNSRRYSAGFVEHAVARDQAQQSDVFVLCADEHSGQAIVPVKEPRCVRAVQDQEIQYLQSHLRTDGSERSSSAARACRRGLRLLTTQSHDADKKL
jgi:hypothetical protein